MFEDNIDQLLPQDDELVRRENVFMGLFDKYSVAEDEDAELADMDLSDNKIHEDENEDDNASGSSFSEASSIEGEEDDDDDDEDGPNGKRLMDKLTEQFATVVHNRVNAWPKKGINLQLKRYDPSVSIDEWLKANQESTTTTKKYKKTVENENNKTVTTTTKHTKTTTTKSSFNTFVPRLMAIRETKDQRPQQILPEIITEITDDHNDTPPKATGKTFITKKKLKNQRPLENYTKDTNKLLPVTIPISPLADYSRVIDEPTFNEPEPPKRKTSRLHKKGPKPTQTESKSKSKEKTKRPTVERQVPTLNHLDHLSLEMSSRDARRSLRLKFKENISPPVHEPLKTKKVAPAAATTTTVTHKKTRSKKQENGSDDDPASRNSKSKSWVLRSRAPLKLQPVNQISTPHKLPSVRVNITKLPEYWKSTRNRSRIQQRALDGTVNVTNANVALPPDSDPPLDSYIDDAPVPTAKRSTQRISKQNKSILRRPPIVVHSPNSETLLGTMIDDKLMLVNKSDYAKHINAKHLQRTKVLDRSVIPINRRIVYQPPIGEKINDTLDADSEGEDVLLSSYLYTGHIEQYK